MGEHEDIRIAEIYFFKKLCFQMAAKTFLLHRQEMLIYANYYKTAQPIFIFFFTKGNCQK